MADLRECPFCGGGFIVNSRGVYEHDNENCLFHGIELKNAKDVEEWNTRKPMEDAVAELENVAFERFGNDGMGGQKVVALDDAISIVRGKE